MHALSGRLFGLAGAAGASSAGAGTGRLFSRRGRGPRALYDAPPRSATGPRKDNWICVPHCEFTQGTTHLRFRGARRPGGTARRRRARSGRPTHFFGGGGRPRPRPAGTPVRMAKSQKKPVLERSFFRAGARDRSGIPRAPAESMSGTRAVMIRPRWPPHSRSSAPTSGADTVAPRRRL
mgnify:CR=1 FL=1